ncbi:MAG: DUF502 domain-containing protein [Verrucomicrobia bacterium]|nr:DUF502 domain-containing protein [Verrucomicrobiota bacterium]
MKKYFLTGLVILLPIAVTIAIIAFIINLLTKPFMGLVTQLLSHTQIPSWGIITSEQMVRSISQAIILFGLFLITLVLGMVARWFLFHALLKGGDKLIYRIPLVNKVYKTTKDIITTLFASKKNSFKQVVMVPFPTGNCYCLGLVTRDAPQTCQKATKTEMVTVFIPTTPNPTTGYLMVCPTSDLILLNMKSEDAIKYIVSCGAIQPGKKETV